MKKLLPWLPVVSLVIALLAVGVAWGQNQNEITNLDKRLTKAEQTQGSVNKLATTQSAIDERTRNIQSEVKETKRLIEAIRAELMRRPIVR